jgi:hypothetical protein
LVMKKATAGEGGFKATTFCRESISLNAKWTKGGPKTGKSCGQKYQGVHFIHRTCIPFNV